MNLFHHPLWPHLQPHAHVTAVRGNLDFLGLPEDLRTAALALELPCVSCGVLTHPLRARAKSERSRIAGTEVEHRLFYAATCPQEANAGCARTTAAKNHKKLVALVIEGLARVAPPAAPVVVPGDHGGHPRLTLAQVEQHGGYGVVYADPAWNYDQKVRVTLDEAQYPTMSQEQVEALPVRRLAAKDSALFLWCTWPHVALGNHVRVMRAWGYEPKTLAFLWVKRNKNAGTLFWGNGSWTRANTEPCFLATRGHPTRVDKGVHQVLEDFVPEEVLDADRPDGVHSKKPAVVRERIERLLGKQCRIELFSRNRVAGWDGWGRDYPGGDDVLLME